MSNHSAKRNTLLDRITAFLLMVTISLGKARGRAAVHALVGKARLLDKIIKIGFKVLLYLMVLGLLFFLKAKFCR